jgi:hypothetical protein
VDDMTWKEYEQRVEERIADLHSRVHRGAYRAQPLTAGLHPETGWSATASRNRGTGRQDRAASCGTGRRYSGLFRQYQP